MAIRTHKCRHCPRWTEECDDIMAKRGLKYNTHMLGETLCWCCANAVPKVNKLGELDGCEWSLYRQPVPGWDAEKMRLSEQEISDIITYLVNDCPKFKRG